MAFKLSESPKFSVQQEISFNSIWMVSFLILGLKCNLIFAELFVFKSFEAGNLVWLRTTVQKNMAAVHFTGEGGGEGTPLYGVYRYMHPQSFLAILVRNMVLSLDILVTNSG